MYAAGAAKRSASIRSRTPPWPPSSLPLSLTCMSRLTADSKRSPTVLASAITVPSTIASQIERNVSRSS